ncbi:DUF4426 domain-containing protein [Pseudoxanthomonas kalamensis]|uniref:DUF4426 domain-containing protein n=1 Tax=Pseudoxanthomonas kalamensis TaxID=289483 RepID=UPI0013915A74|nr:DUF4426 domain-containing protein [Pseudoxanthomonas kalamensis]
MRIPSLSPRLPALAFLLALAACSESEQPRPAQPVPPTQSVSEFGDLRVRYNALPTLSMNEAVAREYGVQRDAGTALLVIALRKAQAEDEIAADGQVEAVVVDLQGRRQEVELRAAGTGDYVDHIGTFAIDPHDTYRIEARIRHEGRTETVKFQRSF